MSEFHFSQVKTANTPPNVSASSRRSQRSIRHLARQKPTEEDARKYDSVRGRRLTDIAESPWKIPIKSSVMCLLDSRQVNAFFISLLTLQLLKQRMKDER